MFLADTRRKRLRSSLSSTFSESNEASSFSTASSSLRRRLSSEWVVPTSSNLADSLKGVTICVTGLSPDSKSRCHELVEQLGGSFTRHLDSSQNTHLIALSPDGPKYEAAISCPAMLVVKPSWLEACYQSKSRVLEIEHTLEKTKKVETSVPEPISLFAVLNQILPIASFNDRIFSSCIFMLVGFDEQSEERIQLGQLIRKGWGTIYWEMNDSVSHLIVSDGCDESVRTAIRTDCLHHPNRLVVVSPWWLFRSWQEKRLVSQEDYPPKISNEKEREPALKARPQAKKKTTRSSALFRGCLFVLVRMAPPADAADFDATELEEIVRLNGGQMLSLKLVEALRADAGKQNFEQRNCYVLCWGGYHAPTQMTLHPLLAQVKRYQLANIHEVTPIWFQTCIADQRKYAPHMLPHLFQPQPWPLRLLRKPDAGGKAMNEIKVSVTGFLTPERTAIIQLIQALGAVYDDTMRTTTSHLICKEPVGAKFQKAVEWGLHVLSVDWLYHIAQYGYNGRDKKCFDGCENRFALAKRTILIENPSSVKDWDADESQEVASTQ